MKKRILDRVTEAADKGAGWVKSGEAKKALGRLGKKTAEVAREAKVALDEAAHTAGEALQEGVQTIRSHIAVETPVDPSKVAPPAPPPPPEGAQLSEDDRAALRKRERKVTTASITVRCTHCDKPVSVAADAELAKCPSCNQRFWIELAERA
jgi:DNA-directed RNA polymerase subunit RPC12/RpoP